MKEKRVDQPLIVRRNQNTLAIGGMITFDNVSLCLAKIEALNLDSVECTDFSGVTYTDSSAICLLIEIYKMVSKQSRSMSFSGVSPTLKKLMQLYGVEQIIGSPNSYSENIPSESTC